MSSMQPAICANWFSWIALPLFLFCCARVTAHGSVVDDGDVCLLTMGFYTAHFTIYQPEQSGHREFCEDIPDASETVFVMEFEHQSLRMVPVEFRVIRDRQERGRFVRWQDLEGSDQLLSDTVLHLAPAYYPHGVLTALHRFPVSGDYIGIVTAAAPDGTMFYHGVFPFRVGAPAAGYWPWIFAILILLQVNYWLMNGGWTALRSRRP